VNTTAKLSLVIILTAGAPAAWGQDSKRPNDPNDVVVFLNAGKQENMTCVVPTEEATDSKSCIGACYHYLIQGRRMQFRVVNRKFFSDYTINVDGITQLKQIPIQELEEAANLQIPTPSGAAAAAKGVAPKGLAVAGQLTLRTAQDLLAELVDEGKSSNPANELLSDWLVVQREAKKVEEEAAALDKTWMTLYDVPGRTGPQSLGAPTITSAIDYLNQLYTEETTREWVTTKQSYTNENAFRELTVKINDAITMINTFGQALALNSSKLNAQISALDGDVAQLNADLNALRGNLVAANNAVRAFNNLEHATTEGPALTKLRRAQIKVKLMQDLNVGGATGKPALDDAELNHLLDSYKFYLEHAHEIAREGTDGLQRTVDSVHSSLSSLLGELGGSDKPDEAYARTATQSLATNLHHLNVDLPDRIDKINAAQSQVLARANDIYDHSAISYPLDKVIDLGNHGGNLNVYFSVRRIDVYPRYVVPVIGVQASGQQGTPLPPPAASAATPPSGAQPPPASGGAQSAGIVVAHGEFEVHDFYRATVVGAFAFSGIKDVSVKSKAITTGTSTDGTNTACTTTTPCSQPFLEKGAYLSSLLVGVTYYVNKQGHDTFPYAHNSFNQNLGILGGASATMLNSYFLGLSYEPAQAFQISGGVNFVSQDAISGRFNPNTVYAGSPAFGGGSKWTEGGFVSVGFNLSIFRKIFGSVTGLGTKATGAGN
jgi:outer membrane murein-binding lipoprotein Lpp